MMILSISLPKIVRLHTSRIQRALEFAFPLSEYNPKIMFTHTLTLRVGSSSRLRAIASSTKSKRFYLPYRLYLVTASRRRSFSISLMGPTGGIFRIRVLTKHSIQRLISTMELWCHKMTPYNLRAKMYFVVRFPKLRYSDEASGHDIPVVHYYG